MLLRDRGGGVDNLLRSLAQLDLELPDQLPLFFCAHLASHFLIDLNIPGKERSLGQGLPCLFSILCTLLESWRGGGEIGKGGEGRFGTGRILLNSNRKIRKKFLT